MVNTQCIKTPKGLHFLSAQKLIMSNWNLSQNDLEKMGLWLPLKVLVTGFFFMQVRHVFK
jgi:hypothetical protein